MKDLGWPNRQPDPVGRGVEKFYRVFVELFGAMSHIQSRQWLPTLSMDCWESTELRTYVGRGGEKIYRVLLKLFGPMSLIGIRQWLKTLAVDGREPTELRTWVI